MFPHPISHSAHAENLSFLSYLSFVLIFQEIFDDVPVAVDEGRPHHVLHLFGQLSNALLQQLCLSLFVEIFGRQRSRQAASFPIGLSHIAGM